MEKQEQHLIFYMRSNIFLSDTVLLVFVCSEMDEVRQYTDELEVNEESEVLDVVREIREKQRARCKPKARPSVKLDLVDVR